LKKTTLSLLVTNRFGVLTKVATMFGRRGCNIHSLTVCPTHDPKRSHITVTLYDDDDKITQIRKQLMKLEDVKYVRLTDENAVEREVALLHLAELPDMDCPVYIKNQPLQDGTYIVEAMGRPEEIDALMQSIPLKSILAISRSGSSALCYQIK
jgi:acetolactate synthase-1/3 small subunit